MQVEINSMQGLLKQNEATDLSAEVADEVINRVESSPPIPVEAHSSSLILGTRGITATTYLAESKPGEIWTGDKTDDETQDSPNHVSVTKFKPSVEGYLSPDDIHALERSGGEPRDIGPFVDPRALY